MASSCFRIYRDNFIDLDAIAEQLVSSEQANFPVTNINNKQRRSKVWRSNGYFNVTSSNNTLIFEETDGVPLTATLTVQAHTSASSLCTDIETQLESVGGSNYTCTNDSSTGFKFKIASDRVGGGGVFELLMGDASNTCEDLLGFDSVNLADAADHTADFLRINSGEFIRWDMGVSTNPEGFALIGPRNDPIGVSDNAVVKLQGNITNDFTSPGFETTLTYNSKAFLHEKADGIADQPYRYWRVLFEDQNPNGYIQLGAVLLGNFIDPDRGRVQFGLNQNYETRTKSAFSEGGQTFSDIRQPYSTISVQWKALKKADIEDIDILFDDFQTAIPFFISMDSDEVWTTEKERALRFVKFSRAPSYTIVSPNNFEVNMEFREEL